nr:sigma-70 family RNA polymerase sigma factor [Salsipaludibacter albus]
MPFDPTATQYADTVLRVCRAVLGPTPEAEDAWSEAYLAALRAWPDLRPDSNVEGWLVTIAHRKAIDVVRARRRHAVPVGAAPEPRRPGPARAGDDGIPPLRDPRIWDALAALPDKQRACVTYHHVAGLPHAEVASIVGGSVAAARRASSDGIARLRRDLADVLEGGGP